MVENIEFGKAHAESNASYYWLEEYQLVYILNKETVAHTAEDASENIMMLRELKKGKPSLLLIDITHIKFMTREAREIYAKEGVANWVIAIALYTRSVVGRVLGNFFLGFNKPEVPTKLFNDENDARLWLKNKDKL